MTAEGVGTCGADDNQAQAGHLIASTGGVARFVPTRNRIDADTETFIVSDVAVRRLTPKECERLQGFPDDWTAEQSDAARYRQLGNAVAVPVAEWVGRRIVAYIEQSTEAAA